MRKYFLILLSLLIFVLPIEAKKKSGASSKGAVVENKSQGKIDPDSIANPIESIKFKPNISSKKKVYNVVKTTLKGNELTIHLEDAFANMVMTESLVWSAYSVVKAALPDEFKAYNLHVKCHKEPIERYVANFRRSSMAKDRSRIPPSYTPVKVVDNLDKIEPTAGLQDRNIALWNSHGLYYSSSASRWEWMRPRFFGTVEDLLTSSIVLQYLLPMLQNAGAGVFMPRERDINTSEYCMIKSDTANKFVANVEKGGDYWLKVKYKKSAVNDLKIKIKHAGVESNYLLNTTVGYGTWIYVDQLYFNGESEVEVLSESDAIIEAITIGGGMSHKGSGYPRFMEAAYYNLQENGLPDSLLRYTNKKDANGDYKHDLHSRSRWVNYLMGGSAKYPSYPGVKIPIDVSVAVHTDALVRDSNKIMGPLVICTTDDSYPSGYSRMAANDLANFVGDQLLSDLKAAGLNGWDLRGIWHQNYVETRVPKTPAVIIELLSHQNFADMRVALDPKNRFIFARAIYKAILKFNAYQYGDEYVVQPLAVNSFAATFAGSDSVKLSWLPTIDTTEITSMPTKYIVYKRIGDGSFDSGMVVDSSSVTLPIDSNVIYSYKVAAFNEGGESFPSEILAVCRTSASTDTALIVNCFDRVSGPVNFDFGQTSGVSYNTDFGVPYKYDISYTGAQFEFDRGVAYVNNDYPGFGASLADYETQVIAGNSFDYPFIHGQALKECGYSFVSMSKQAFADMELDVTPYSLLDVILGNQKNADGYELLPKKIEQKIGKFTKAKRNILISGSALGKCGGNFAQKTLGISLYSPFATYNGILALPNDSSGFSLQMTPSAERYFVQNVDAFSLKAKSARKLLFYKTNRLTAAVLFNSSYKAISVGFPIEALQSQEQVNALMRYFVQFWNPTPNLHRK